jgi:hypothetical protein
MNFGMKARSVALAAAVALGGSAIATQASAATVVFGNITGTWSAATPGGAVSYSGNGSSNAKAKWGTPENWWDPKKSGYTFAANSPVNAVLGGVGDYGPFTIGTFTHNNWPITGSSITSIKLTIATQIIIDNVDQGVHTFEYLFNHWETDNNVPGNNGACANGQKENASINKNGCADRVKVNYLSSSSNFDVGGFIYTLDFAGFQDGGDPVTEFWTKEKKDNSAKFLANIKMVGPLSSPVPEPATWAMMIIGFGAVGTMVRSSRRRATFAA